MTIKSNKNGYHSTQDTAYGRIPKSEFYGFVLGFAAGMILRGAINLSGLFEINNNSLAYVCCVVGVAIGWWVDQKYYMVKDEPEQGREETAEETKESAEAAVAQASGEQETIEEK